MDSDELAVRGGAGGFFFDFGGGTKPSSLEPSPAQSTVPLQSVAARATVNTFPTVESFFMSASVS